jgi:predicted ATPase
MSIKSLHLKNYKSYEDSNKVEFSPGINIIVGQNNSGKTALLEALTLRFPNNPHRNIEKLPNDFSRIRTNSNALVELSLGKNELRFLIKQISGEPIGLRPPDENNGYWENAGYLAKDVGVAFSKWMDKENNLELSLALITTETNEVDGKILGFFDSEHPYYEPDDGTQVYIELIHNSEGNLNVQLEYEDRYDEEHNYYWDPELVGCKTFRGDIKCSIPYRVFELFRSRIYRFHAERLNLDKCECGFDSALRADASNLAEVINLLPSYSPVEFDRLNELIQTVFPNIRWISSVKISEKIAEIKVWGLDAFNNNRVDLTIPLSNCGTGIGQVVAILYVVVTSRVSRTIIIDEPQSFLHPGAAKKLIDIFKEFPQHQYFIATHSPMLISAADPARIIKLDYDGCQTKISSIDSAKSHEQKMILAELGVKLSDVFGFDNILWVEGQTEEQCFPVIFEKVAKRSLKGTALLRVQTTGQLEGKNAELIFDLYKRLSAG